ncbi:hypothetical protein DPMN_140252 [Dreissena polymorpha]|uniref:Reverse transcriptase domain-containing protein n=1 Tax=Dreissena polymorpha TaxID=45954 RepID=A0A9D4JLK4_DREPO|nr:hypothetical protein DPMN_140252 [Dreissena polymorpha]
MPEGKSDTAIAENFADHFLDKINKIRDALASFEKFTPDHKEVPYFGMFEDLTQDEVKKIINHLQTKSCELDALPTRGSYLGPWLYLTYAGTLFDVVHPSIKVYGFADDHTANKRFKPTSSSVERTAIQELESCALVINNWMNENKLKMNASKTEFIMFGIQIRFKPKRTAGSDSQSRLNTEMEDR